ncbi:hypothetical protein [Robiginitalea sp. SC105]|uniref:hypothetical protein n=1 Tax=Robiginitalea sp. SC105 TaxID=2762332 RepID=UPI00163ABA21|nr:hypothetical protein [Robiginitalea sp. SC105]MBC2838388.1 hypothetical protein [Robiginitalea sp. SC105]
MSYRNKWILRITGVAIVALLLLGSISHIAPGNLLPESPMVTGKYRIASVQDGELQYFEGPVYFELAQQQSGRKPASVFKLHFINPDAGNGSGFGFMIPLPEDLAGIRAEQYTVESQEKGLISRLGTVFGYADVVQEESSLYFTESGSISITNATQEEVTGDMNMVLMDENGHTMRIKGSFNARPLYTQQLN